MKVTNLAIIFIIIIIPFVLVANYQSDSMTAVAYERLKMDQIIDSATMDGVANLVVGFENDGYLISKEAAVESFYRTLYVNLNVLGNEVAQKRVQGYIPIIIVIDYDGYYTLVNRATINNSGYKDIRPIWSEKKPYAYYDGNYIYCFTLTEELTIVDTVEDTIYTGLQGELNTTYSALAIQDDDYFKELKQNTITNLIEEEMEFAINHHNDIASLYGITYRFYLPKIDNDDWANTISDIGMLTFIQGIPLGATNEYYNSFSLGGAGVIKLPQYYIQEDPITGIPYYHKADCPLLTDYSSVYTSKEHCALEGAYPCPNCEP